MSITSYIFIFIWAAYVVVSFLVHPTHSAEVVQFLGYTGIGLIVVHYIIVQIESGLCVERKYIESLSSVISAVEHINRMKVVGPVVTFRAECYHYETRTRTVTSTDSNGRTVSSLETYQVKVVTANIVEPFIFQFWQDQSDAALVGVHRNKITKIKMEQQVLFGDVETANDFDERYSRFKQENNHRDIFVNFSVSRTVPGFKNRMATFVDADAKAWWINSACFWISSLLLFGWIYRLAFKYSTVKITYAVIKSIYVNRPVARSVNNYDSAEVGLTHRHDVVLQNNVNNSHVEQPADFPQLVDPFTLTRRNIEVILRNLENSAQTLPIRQVNDTHLANPSQLRVAAIGVSGVFDGGAQGESVLPTMLNYQQDYYGNLSAQLGTGSAVIYNVGQ